jgi:CRISPR-associated endonuclease Csy4
MKYFTELTLIPDADTPPHYLWKVVLLQIHIGLVEMKDESGKVPVGISFPKYNLKKFQIGNKIRLFGQTEEILETLNLSTRVNKLSDYVHLTSIKPVPERIKGYTTFFKVQKKTYKHTLVRRRAKRHNLTIEQAYKDYENFVGRTINLPYINMISCSTSQRYRLYVEKKEVRESLYEGFNTYGLSRSSTVPSF